MLGLLASNLSCGILWSFSILVLLYAITGVIICLFLSRMKPSRFIAFHLSGDAYIMGTLVFSPLSSTDG